MRNGSSEYCPWNGARQTIRLESAMTEGAGAEQPFLDDWLIGRQERRSQELLGAAAIKFGLQRGAWPVSERAQRALDSLYERTQKMLEQEGVEKITLYRGLEGAEEVKAGKWEEGPLSSWTPLVAMAAAHAQGEGGRIIATTVERTRIVGFFGTGMGSAYTQEYVLSGGEMEITVREVAGESLGSKEVEI
jgi:hypothetical protein